MGHPYPRKLEPIVVGFLTIYGIQLHARWIWEGKQWNGLSFAPSEWSPNPAKAQFFTPRGRSPWVTLNERSR